MLQDVLHRDMIHPYRDDRIKSKFLNRALRPFVEKDHLFFLTMDGDRYRVNRIQAYSYGTLHRPHQPERTFERHQEYLRHLVSTCKRLSDVASVLGVRIGKVYPLLDRYEVDYSHYRMPKTLKIVPDHVDVEEFRDFYEQDAYSVAELMDYFELTTNEVYRIVDRLDMQEPLESVKVAKRSARNPDYGRSWNAEKPRPTALQLDQAIQDGKDTIKKLSEEFETNPVTMARWLDKYGIETPGMKERRRRPQVEIEDKPAFVRQKVFIENESLDTVAKTLKMSRQGVWNIASKFPEWNDSDRSKVKHIEEAKLAQLARAIRRREITGQEAAKQANVSYNTFKKRLDEYDQKRKERGR